MIAKLLVAAWLLGYFGPSTSSSWWWTTGCTADPVVVVVGPGSAGGYCDPESGNAFVWTFGGNGQVVADGVVLRHRTLLPRVSR